MVERQQKTSSASAEWLFSLFHRQKLWMGTAESLHPVMFFCSPSVGMPRTLIQDWTVELETLQSDDWSEKIRATRGVLSALWSRISQLSCFISAVLCLAAGSLLSNKSSSSDKQPHAEKKEPETWVRSECLTVDASAVEEKVSSKLSLWQ